MNWELRTCNQCGRENVRQDHGGPRILEVACNACGQADFRIAPLVAGSAEMRAALNIAIGALESIAEGRQEAPNVAQRAIGMVDAYMSKWEGAA